MAEEVNIQERWMARFRTEADLALQYADGKTVFSDDDLDAIAKAHALSVVLEFLEVLMRMPKQQLEGLRRVGARARLQLGAGDEEDGSLVWLFWIRDGLRALQGKAPPVDASAKGHVSERAIVSFANAKTETYEAAELAVTLRRSVQARELFALLLAARSVETTAAETTAAGSAAPKARLRLAAEGEVKVRNPREGKALGSQTLSIFADSASSEGGAPEAVQVDFVWFETAQTAGPTGTLAVYCDAPKRLRIEADPRFSEGTVEMHGGQAGYVECVCARVRTHFVLAIDEHTVSIELSLPKG